MTTLKKFHIFAIIGVILFLSAPTLVFSQSAQPAAKQPVAGPIDWPKEIQHPKGKIVIYQPQIDEWPEYKVVKARSAIAFLPTGATDPKLGIIEMQARTEVDFETRLVKLSRLQITQGNFPGVTKEQNERALAELRGMVNSEIIRSIELDRMLVSLERAGVKNVELKNDPPKIFFSKRPAVLVIFDGKPVLSPIENSDLKFIVNTNWDVFYYEKTKTFYIRNEKAWLKTETVSGPYSPVDDLPDDFKKLPMNDNWKEVLAAIPPQKLKKENMPVVIVSEQPAELILTKGELEYSPIPQTSLVWVSNSDNDLIFNPADSHYYYLVSGRWFKTRNLESGPWAFATPTLPAEFKKIPADHAIGPVRASIPGTREAEEAIIQASIPQTAKINKNTAKAPEITYAGGKPEFQSIQSTTLKRAANTEYDVIQVKGEYYLCHEGVWFVSKSPTGPWKVAESIPVEIYKIPPSDPAYNVTYVTVQEDDDDTDEWISVAVAAGFFGTLIANDCVFWGTGWYYPPYVWYGGRYPYYYPRYGSYGAAAWYNPYTGTFGRSGWAYGPYGGVGYGARYNPRTGTYARGAAAYGPYGARGYAEAYNPRTGTYARTRQGSNYYSSWGSTAVRRGDDWVKTSHYKGQDGGAVRYRTSDGNRGFAGKHGDDLYAGRDGNVYRRTDSGWQNWDDGKWNNVERDRAAQDRAAQDRAKQDRTQQDRARQDRAAQDRARQDRTTQERTMPVSRTPSRDFSSSTINQLDRQRTQRDFGNQRSFNSQSFQRNRSSMPRSGGFRRSGGGRRG